MDIMELLALGIGGWALAIKLGLVKPSAAATPGGTGSGGTGGAGGSGRGGTGGGSGTVVPDALVYKKQLHDFLLTLPSAPDTAYQLSQQGYTVPGPANVTPPVSVIALAAQPADPAFSGGYVYISQDPNDAARKTFISLRNMAQG